MFRPLHLVGVLAAVSVLGCSAPPTLDQAAEAEAVRQRQSDWVAAENRRDLEATVSFLTADAIIQGEAAPAMKGREAARELWTGIFEVPFSAIEHFQPRTVGVSASGDLAYDIGNFRVVFPPEAGMPEMRGKSSIIWQKQDGVWMAVAISFSMDAPPASSAETEGGSDENA